MKLKAGPTWDEKWKAKEKWHTWFAWYPKRVGPRERRWLEFIERRRYGTRGGLHSVSAQYEYRVPAPQQGEG